MSQVKNKINIIVSCRVRRDLSNAVWIFTPRLLLLKIRRGALWATPSSGRVTRQTSSGRGLRTKSRLIFQLGLHSGPTTCIWAHITYSDGKKMPTYCQRDGKNAAPTQKSESPRPSQVRRVMRTWEGWGVRVLYTHSCRDSMKYLGRLFDGCDERNFRGETGNRKISPRQFP